MTMVAQMAVREKRINRRRSGRPSWVNIGMINRLASALGGAALAAYSIKRRPPGTAAWTALGALFTARGITGFCPMNKALNINTSRPSGERARPEDYYKYGIHVRQSFTVNRPAQELFTFWRDFSNLARFMQHVRDVRVISDTRSHWVVDGPAGKAVEWDAEIIEETPGHLIAWRSLDNADVDCTGSVRFTPAPGGRGTEVAVSLEYIPPAGRLGQWLAALFGKAPTRQIEQDLRNFKKLMETGEVTTTKGQPQGACSC
jgi:uncharacterized membrane protein